MRSGNSGPPSCSPPRAPWTIFPVEFVSYPPQPGPVELEVDWSFTTGPTTITYFSNADAYREALGVPQCGDWNLTAKDVTFICTRPRGHEGPCRG